MTYKEKIQFVSSTLSHVEQQVTEGYLSPQAASKLWEQICVQAGLSLYEFLVISLSILTDRHNT